MIDIVVPSQGELTSVTLPSATRPSIDERTVIDLRGLSFVDSAGVVLVAAVARHAVEQGRPVEYHPPARESDCSKYLHRMGVARELGVLGIDARLSPVRWHSAKDRLLQLQSFRSDDGAVDELADTMYRIIAQTASRDLAEPLCQGLSELGANVVEHSSASCGYLALQQYDVGRPGQRISFCIADTGIGLRRSLASSYSVADDEHAVRLAVTEGVSGTGRVGRGHGLADVLASTNGGRLVLWSGSGRAEFRGDRVGGPPLAPRAASFPGTFVHATVIARQDGRSR